MEEGHLNKHRVEEGAKEPACAGRASGMGRGPRVWPQGAVWIRRRLSTSPAGGERPGVVKTPLPFDPTACGTANPSRSADLELLPAGTCRPTGVSYLPEFRSLAARPSATAISSTLSPPTHPILLDSLSTCWWQARVPSTGRFTAISNRDAAPTPSVVPPRSTAQLQNTNQRVGNRP